MMRTLIAALMLASWLPAAPPEVGEQAPDFELPSISGERVRLSNLTDQGRVALIFLRGYPGYQCPVCNRQVHDLLASAERFNELGVHVLLVYPGPSEGLQKRAEEFAADKPLPGHFEMLLDPGYQAVTVYRIRWEAEGETAYPSTFLLEEDREVFYRKISDSHGGRTTAGELIAAFETQD